MVTKMAYSGVTGFGQESYLTSCQQKLGPDSHREQRKQNVETHLSNMVMPVL